MNRSLSAPRRRAEEAPVSAFALGTLSGLVGLGFKPFQSAGLNLRANPAPVAWGAIGTPIVTLAAVSGLDEVTLSAAAGLRVPGLDPGAAGELARASQDQNGSLRHAARRARAQRFTLRSLPASSQPTANQAAGWRSAVAR